MNKWGMLEYDKYIQTMQNDLKLLDFVGSKPRRVLCFGCSAGAELKMFQDRGCEVVGYEPNPNAVEVCRANGFEIYNVLKEVPGKFDLVFCREVIEHTKDPFKEFIDVIPAYLNKGAFLYVQTPYPDFDEKMGKYTYASQHYNLFPIDTLVRLFNKKGFLVKYALQSDGCGVCIFQC